MNLHQYGGEGRGFHRTQTRGMSRSTSGLRGIEQKLLYEDGRFPDATRLERWAPGATPGPRELPGGAELFIPEGALEDAEGRYPTGTWLRLPAGSTLEAISRDGCVAYVKTGALPTLRSA